MKVLLHKQKTYLKKGNTDLVCFIDMNDFNYFNPTRILFGSKTETYLPKEIKKYGKKMNLLEEMNLSQAIGDAEKIVQIYALGQQLQAKNSKIDKTVNVIQAFTFRHSQFIIHHLYTIIYNEVYLAHIHFIDDEFIEIYWNLIEFI